MYKVFESKVLLYFVWKILVVLEVVDEADGGVEALLGGADKAVLRHLAGKDGDINGQHAFTSAVITDGNEEKPLGIILRHAQVVVVEHRITATDDGRGHRYGRHLTDGFGRLVGKGSESGSVAGKNGH